MPASGRQFVHEIANAVNILMAQCYLIEIEGSVTPAMRKRLDAIETVAERIAKALRDFGPNLQ